MTQDFFMADWLIITLSSILGGLLGWLSSFFHIRAKEKEREKSERQLFIHQKQFEKEFDVLCTLWSLVIELRKSSLRASGGDSGEQVSLGDCQKLIDTFVEDSIPFIMPNIQQRAKDISDTTAIIGTLIDINQTRPRQMLEEQGEEFKKLNDQISNLGEAIRSRLLLKDDKGKS